MILQHVEARIFRPHVSRDTAISTDFVNLPGLKRGLHRGQVVEENGRVRNNFDTQAVFDLFQEFVEIFFACVQASYHAEFDFARVVGRFFAALRAAATCH